MWHLARQLSRSEADRASIILDQLRLTIRNLLVVSGVFSLVSALLISVTWNSQRIQILLPGILVVGLIYLLANTLLETRYVLALVVWFAAILLTIGLACWLTRNPDLALLSAVLPLIAVITIGGWAGVAAEAAIIGLVWGLFRAPFLFPMTPEQAYLMIGAGAFCGLLGWTASKELMGLADWSLANFDRMRRNLDEVQDRQIELLQTQEDLALANRELARLSKRSKALEHIAEEARQAKTEFVANVSHELRTPLNMIIGYADLISRSPQVYGGRLPSALITDIRAILRNAQHLSTLVNDVLDLSQVEAGRMALSRDWVSLPDTIEQALTGIKGLFESKNLYLKTEITADLPPIYYDETRIRQVIINLLSNAGRFTGKGGVTLGCRPEGGELVVSVADTGPGIADKDQERVFDPFQQANPSIRRQYGGSGLGLTISKQFIEMHGGRMWLESRPGEGTTFFFSLPIEEPALPLADQAGHRLLRALTPDDEIGYHIRTRHTPIPQLAAAERYVIVDPEQTLLRLLNRYLPEIAVEAAPDVAAAVQSLNQSPAQALILNVSGAQDPSDGAPGNLPFGTPAITCRLPGEHEAAHRLGVLDYLIKPLSQEKLSATLKEMSPPVKTILIVDDEEDELNLFARLLEADEHGYQILQVTSGQRALSMLRSRRPDVMLLDLNMPVMDGFQVLEEKRRDPAIRDIPAIIVSSRDPAGDPILSNTFSVTHSGGLSQRNLIACMHAVSQILAPSAVQENK